VATPNRVKSRDAALPGPGGETQAEIPATDDPRPVISD
jgi:hypothetical protein